MEAPSVERELFGGAMRMGVPARFDDCANFRQVPDNQEVFADAQTDQSFIVEILEYEADIRDAVRGHHGPPSRPPAPHSRAHAHRRATR